MLLAFPHLFVRPDASHEYRPGALYSLPAELCDQYRMAKYLLIKNAGWHRSEFGYQCFVKEDDFGNRYILPGLHLTDASPPSKKFYGYKPTLTKSLIAGYVEQHLKWENDIRKKSELELTALVHDLRHLSSSIYHSAVEAEKALTDNDRAKTLEDIKTIIASQTMLKVRIDYLDFSNSVDRFVERERIPVYSRVDKVIRCFRPSARHKRIDIQLTGQSYRLAEGPNILDIVPYTIIENAIKYAPNSSRITVDVNDAGTSTNVSVSSLGPKLSLDEHSTIFQRGVRGTNAIKVREGGTGLGLAVASRVISVFSGKIDVRQDVDARDIGGVPHSITTFNFSVPTSGEDTRRRARFNNRRRATISPK